MRQRLLAGCLLVALLGMAVAQTAPDYRPKFKGDPAHSEPEAAALGYMRTVVQAQRDYKKKFNHYATTLAALVGGSRSFTRRMIKTDRGDYTVEFHGGKENYSLALTPKAFDSAHRAFYTDASGHFRAETDKPATAESPALTSD